MRTLYKKVLIAASVSTLLFLGALPLQVSWDDGISGIAEVHAAGGRGSGGSGSHESGGSHESPDHGTDHATGHGDDVADDHEHDESEGGHESGGGKGKKGPMYRGGRTGSANGRGGPGQAVIEKIFESE